MTKRARRLNIDMNVLGLSSLETLQAVFDNELAHATKKGQKLQLLFWMCNVKCYLNERKQQTATARDQ